MTNVPQNSLTPPEEEGFDWGQFGIDALSATATGGLSMLPGSGAAKLGASFGGGAAAVLDIMPGKGGGNFQAYLQGLTADKARLHDARQKEYDRSAALERQLIQSGTTLLTTDREITSREKIANDRLAVEKEKLDIEKRDKEDLRKQAVNRDSAAWVNQHGEMSGPQLAKVLAGMNAFKIADHPELLDQLNDPNHPNHANAIQNGIVAVHNLVGTKNAGGTLDLTIEASHHAQKLRDEIRKRVGDKFTDDEFTSFLQSDTLDNIWRQLQIAETIATNKKDAAVGTLEDIRTTTTQRRGTNASLTFSEASETYDNWRREREQYREIADDPSLNYPEATWTAEKERFNTSLRGDEINLLYDRKEAFKRDAARLIGAQGSTIPDIIGDPIWQGLADDPSLWGEGFIPAMQGQIQAIDALIAKLDNVPAHLRGAFLATNGELDALTTWMEDNDLETGTDVVVAFRNHVKSNTKAGPGGMMASGIGAQESLTSLGMMQLGAEYSSSDFTGNIEKIKTNYNDAVSLDAVKTSLANTFENFGLKVPGWTQNDTDITMKEGINGQKYVADADIDRAATFLVAGFMSDAGLPHVNPETGKIETPSQDEDADIDIDASPETTLESLRTRLFEKRNGMIAQGLNTSPEFLVIDQAYDEVTDRYKRLRLQSDEIGNYAWEERTLSDASAAKVASDMVKLRQGRTKQSLQGVTLGEALFAIKSLNPRVAARIEQLEEQGIEQIDDPIFHSRGAIKKAMKRRFGYGGAAVPDSVTAADGRQMIIDSLLAHIKDPSARRDMWSYIQAQRGWDLAPRSTLHGTGAMTPTDEAGFFGGYSGAVSGSETFPEGWLFEGLDAEQTKRMQQILNVLQAESEGLVGEGNNPGGVVSQSFFATSGTELPPNRFYTSKEEKQLFEDVGRRMHQGPTVDEFKQELQDARLRRAQYQTIVNQGGNDQYGIATAQALLDGWDAEATSLDASVGDFQSVQGVVDTYVAGPVRGFFLNLSNKGMARSTTVLDPTTVSEDDLQEVFLARLGATMNEQLGLDLKAQLGEFVQEIAGVAAELDPIELYTRVEEAFSEMAPAIIKKGYTQADVGRLHVVETADEQTDSNATLMEAYMMNDAMMSFTYDEIIKQTPQLAPYLPGAGYDEASDELKAVLLVLAEQEAQGYRPSEARDKTRESRIDFKR